MENMNRDSLSSCDSASRPKTVESFPYTRKYGTQKITEKERQNVTDTLRYEDWSKYGDNHKMNSRPRITQDFGKIIDLPGPGEYTPKPELLSTEETMPKYNIAVRYPLLVFGEKDLISNPPPIYDIPAAVAIRDSHCFKYHVPANGNHKHISKGFAF